MIQGSIDNTDAIIVRYGMIGGGEGSFIGDVHRKAALLDGKCKLVAGYFALDYNDTLKTGEKYGLDPDRLYKSFEEMAISEANREDGIDFVTIVTPNYAHYGPVKAFLNSGINVICEKPLVFTVEEAEELVELAKEKGLLFCVNYAYTAYPMVKQARKLVKDGKIGEIISVMGEYAQDWLILTIEKQGQMQASWRTNPKQSGISNCMGDIGSHIENMVSYITGLKIQALCAKLDVIGEGRTLDTNSTAMVKYDNGATGVYWASQVAIGNDNALKVRIFGTKGSIEWCQEDGNNLKVTYVGQPTQILSRGHDYLYSEASSRLPSGHIEGYYEAFANIYNTFASTLIKKKSGITPKDEDFDFPDGISGQEGVKFINKCVESSNAGSVWVEV